MVAPSVADPQALVERLLGDAGKDTVVRTARPTLEDVFVAATAPARASRAVASAS
jgi:hypothetical protein